MSGWKRLYPKPAGSLPGGIVTQWGVALITVLILVFAGMWLASGGGEETPLETAVADVTAPARDFAGSMAAQVEAEAMRAETRRSAAERALQAQQRQEALEAGSAIGAGQVRLDEARLLAGASPDTGEAYTEEEWELRERLRLEALERRSRSLRSSPVAQTYRQLDRSGAARKRRSGRTPRRTSPPRSAPRAPRLSPRHSEPLRELPITLKMTLPPKPRRIELSWRHSPEARQGHPKIRPAWRRALRMLQGAVRAVNCWRRERL